MSEEVSIRSSLLVELEPGPMPIIPKAMWAELSEWLAAWRHADALREEGLTPPGALLLHGPTGTGKTSLARALLKHMGGRPGLILESHNAVTGLFGQSAKNVADAFDQAAAADALLVIEEIDALGMDRAKTGKAGLAAEETRITVALMRALESATFPVIATTNFHGALDAALLRRFEMQMEVPALDAKGRAIILKKILNEEPPEELIALPLVESIRLAHRLRRRAFIATLEGRGAK
jgi:SpoVK/Ycf46/Vps4 family AAA+-type ATPase